MSRDTSPAAKSGLPESSKRVEERSEDSKANGVPDGA